MKTLVPRSTKAAGIEQVDQANAPYGGTYIPIENLRTWTGYGVSPETALNVITVLQCVNQLAKTFASLPLFVYRRRAVGEGRDIARDHPLYATLHDMPNPEMTSFVWRELLMQNLKTWGNHFSEIVRYPGGLELWPLRPDRMEVRWGPDARRVYTYRQSSGETKMKPGSVFHVQGMGTDGLVGFSPITVMRRTVGLANSAEQYGEAVFRNGARPAIVMSHPQTLSDDAVTRLGAQMDALRGSGNAGKTVILEEGLSMQEVGFPPEDAQFMQTRLFQKRDLAGYYDIPGLMVGDPDGKEKWDDASRRFMSGMQSDLERFEQEAKRQLVEKGDDVYVEFKAEGFLRADPKARADANAVQWEHGNLNNDDWRQQENLDPLPNGLGQVYYRPANWVPLGEDPVAVGGDASAGTQFGSGAGLVDQLTRAKSVRCPACDKLLIPELTGAVKMTCYRCKAEVEVTSEVVPEVAA